MCSGPAFRCVNTPVDVFSWLKGSVPLCFEFDLEAISLEGRELGRRAVRLLREEGELRLEQPILLAQQRRLLLQGTSAAATARRPARRPVRLRLARLRLDEAATEHS